MALTIPRLALQILVTDDIKTASPSLGLQVHGPLEERVYKLEQRGNKLWFRSFRMAKTEGHWRSTQLP